MCAIHSVVVVVIAVVGHHMNSEMSFSPVFEIGSKLLIQPTVSVLPLFCVSTAFFHYTEQRSGVYCYS